MLFTSQEIPKPLQNEIDIFKYILRIFYINIIKKYLNSKGSLFTTSTQSPKNIKNLDKK